jgi:molybdopterin-guanine dinucleotide biosynthesis protein B
MVRRTGLGIHEAVQAETALRRIHIVGRKNSGKTTLVAELVTHLTSRGLRVGTIKHTHHRHELDTPGKDSHRHRLAGAVVVGVMSPGMSAVFVPSADPERSEQRYELLSDHFAGCDLVLVEGDLMAAAPKVEVWRAAVVERPYAAEHGSIRAVISDDAAEVAVPVWPRAQLDVIADGIWEIIRA